MGRGHLQRPTCVLVVDDNRDQHAILRVLLGHYGYQTVHATSLEDARTVLDDERIDLVILEIRLGREHGLDLLYSMPLEGSLVPILVCTSDAFAEYKYPRARQAAAGWLVKPVDFSVLLQTIQRIVSPPGT